MKTILQVVMMIGVSLTTLAAFAQRGPYGGPPGGPGGPPSPYGGRGGSYGGPGGPGGYGGPGGSFGDRSRSGGDRQYTESEIKERLERSEAMLRELDTNHNGILEPNEVPEDRRRLMEFMAQRAGYELKLPMAIAQMRQHSENYYRSRSAGATPGGMSPGMGSPGGPPPGRPSGPPGSSPGSPDEMKSRLAGLESFLKSMDKNGNGILEADEVPADRRRGLEFMAQRAGYELKFPLSIATAMKSAEDASRARSSGATPGGPPSGAGNFGPPSSGPGFSAGTSPPSSSSNDSRSSSSRSRSSSQMGSADIDSATQQRIRDFVASFMRQYDKSSNGRLEKEEWPGGSFGSFDEANRTGGSVISSDELVIHFTDYLKRGLLSSSMLGGGGWGGPLASAKTKSGRSLSPLERLPKGLPSWFLRLDVDADGQVTMAEFSRDWTPETADQFDRYDLNHDGVITPEECLKVERMPK
jgi:hypothetical protein